MPDPISRALRASRIRLAALALVAVAASALTVLVPAAPAEAAGPTISCTSDPSILNTGYDRNGGRLTSGSDLGWEFAGAYAGPYGPAPIVTAPPAQWVTSPFGNASWISHSANTLHAGRLFVWYRYRFMLDPAVDPAGFSVALDFFADNSVRDVAVNGVSQTGKVAGLPQAPSNPHLYLGYAPGYQARLTLDNDWVSGQNEIIVWVDSSQYSQGFLAQTTSQGFCSDYGDAPDSYGTTKASNGPSHLLTDYNGSTTSLMLGSTVDEEPDASGLTGTDDDATGRDDEDGGALAPRTALATTYSVTLDVTNTTGADATLAGWIDTDRDGVFQQDERATAQVAAGATQATLNWSGLAATPGDTFARFRLFPGTVADPSPTGAASGGEVEDYPLTISPGDLEITKTVNAVSVEDGDPVEYTITIHNPNTTVAENVSITDDLSDVLDDADFDSSSASSGTVALTGQVLTWNGDVAANSTVTIRYTVIARAKADGDGTLSNTVVDTSRPGTDTSDCPLGSTDAACVVDTVLSAGVDFGDAPASYDTSKVDDGPQHVLYRYDSATHTSAVGIGAQVDAEADAAADDDATGVADEDGVTLGPLRADQTGYSADLAVVNTSGRDATLAGWVDANADGVFDPAERAFVTVPAGATSAQLSWTGLSPVASSTWVRFRIFLGSVADPQPTGLVAGGEVEDMPLTIAAAPGGSVLGLAFTGGPGFGLAGVGAVLLLLGAGLVASRRRRRVS
jgi:uncharacterized repeat protein (TIGR01451 family)